MPSTTKKQARFMAAVAHGWKPSQKKAPPVSVAKEFNKADVGKGVIKPKKGRTKR
jgi:hypothetical protein